MTYNLSPDYIILDPNQAKKLHNEGKKLHKISFQYGGRIIRGWTIFHENKIDPNDPNCQFGVYGIILNRLFNLRSKIKKEHLIPLKERIEELESKGDLNELGLRKEYDELVFQFNCYDSVQKALPASLS